MNSEKKAFVFDLDGTLFETSARVLGSNSSPSFIEFADSTKLLTESTPLPLLYLAQEVCAEGHQVYILTARKSIIARAIKELLLSYNVHATYVYCVGDRGLDIPAYKAEILGALNGLNLDAVYYFDDETPNLIMAEKTGVYVRRA